MCRMNFLMLGAALLVRSVLLFWNLENAFDPYDDPLTRDEEFTPGGARHWTWKKMDRKLVGVAKTILVAADTYGEPPVLIGLCEVENATVVRRLAEKTPLAAYDYGWVHRDSPDGRGIDVALLFRRDAFKVLHVEAIPVATDPPTRDILYVKGMLWRDTVHVFVNHWPSKLGGAAGRSRRDAAAEALRACVDSIDAAARPAGREPLILCGDFNATPVEINLPIPGLVNLATPLAAAGEGSIKYRGTWELIDQFWVRGFGASPTTRTPSAATATSVTQSAAAALANSSVSGAPPAMPSSVSVPEETSSSVSGVSLSMPSTVSVRAETAVWRADEAPAPSSAVWEGPRMEIFRPPFLLEPDKSYTGDKPLRTWSGPHYKGGLSDHLPVVLIL